MSYKRNNFNEFKLLGTGFSVLALLVLGLSSVSIVPANHVGVKYSVFEGTSDKTLKEGIQFKTPLVDKVYKLPTTVQSSSIYGLSTQTSDSQFLTTALDVKWRISKSNAMKVFKDFTKIETLQNEGIIPTVQRAIEDVTPNYNIVEILGSKRNEVYAEIEKALKTRLEAYGVELVAVTITDTDAGEEIESAIKNEAVKQKEVDTAKQEQEKAKISAETKKIDAQAKADVKLIEAEAEAEANRKLASSITDELIKLKEAEARMEHGWVEVQGVGSAIVDSGN